MMSEEEFIRGVYKKYEEAKKNNWKGYESIFEGEKPKKTKKVLKVVGLIAIILIISSVILLKSAFMK